MKIVHENSYGIIPIYKNSEGEYLYCIVQRTIGHWSFPKGHKDGTESDEETARREVFEETGIDDITIIPNKMFTEEYSFQEDSARHEKIVKYFLGQTGSMKVSISAKFRNEIGDIKWLPYYELLKQLTFPESRKIAEDVNIYLRNNT